MPVATTVRVVGGDGQQADPADILPDSIQFRVLDAAGKPMSGVRLDLTTPVGGGIAGFDTITTDSAGFAATTWTMGPFGGIQQMNAGIGGKLFATVSATTCDPSDCYPHAQVAGGLSDATLLSLATYDGSGQAVHPDVVRSHGSSTGFWMVVTPYPGGNTYFENPSIFKSKDAATWKVPAGIINPMVRPEPSAYLSDPDLIVNTDHNLWMYYREVLNGQNIIRVTQSRNGVNWDSARTVITAPSHQVISPAIVRGAPHAPWQMWSVNSGPQGCSAPTTTVERRVSLNGLDWDAPITVDLAQPGQAIWHIDVQWVPALSEYWAVYNTYPSGTSCATNALYLATSPDGVHWNVFPSPIARAGLIDPFKHLIYRSTFMINPKATQIMLWFSGAEYKDNTYVWSTGTVATTLEGVLGIASAPSSQLHALPFFGKLPPPEPDIGPAQR